MSYSLPDPLFSSHFVKAQQKEKKNETAVTVLKHIYHPLWGWGKAEIHHSVCDKVTRQCHHLENRAVVQKSFILSNVMAPLVNILALLCRLVLRSPYYNKYHAHSSLLFWNSFKCIHVSITVNHDATGGGMEMENIKERAPWNWNDGLLE